MTPDEIAKVLNKTRRERGETEINREELLSLINETKREIMNNNLDAEEKRALEEFRMRELERSIKETPYWVKIVWTIILGGIIYLIFK